MKRRKEKKEKKEEEKRRRMGGERREERRERKEYLHRQCIERQGQGIERESRTDPSPPRRTSFLFLGSPSSPNYTFLLI